MPGPDMDDKSTLPAVDAELLPNVNESTMPETPAALEKTDPAHVEAVFARVEQAIERLPNEIVAIQ